MKMVQRLHVRLLVVTVLVSITLPMSHANVKSSKNGEKSAVFLSPKIELGYGSAAEKYFYDIDFPRGHIAVKDFNAELVDEAGNPVPLYETYLHHWVVVGYRQRKAGFGEPDSMMLVDNSNSCAFSLGRYFGLGSETRKTITRVPDPYGIELGNPAEIPPGYEEKWLLNVHTIDTRGVEDRLGCLECRCDLYNVTRKLGGGALDPGYIGGMECCYDGVQCQVRQGFTSVKRSLHLRYTIKWVEFDATIVVPVRILLFDVTDTWEKSKDDSEKHKCLNEYQVDSCSDVAGGRSDKSTYNTKRVSLTLPKGGVVVYGVAHQHIGAAGATLYGEDGRVICSSKPIYGTGTEAGDEAGYVVGISSCNPHPGNVTISDGETLSLVSHYNCSQRHTGVMGQFYLLMVADANPPDPSSSLHPPFEKHEEIAIRTSFVRDCIKLITCQAYSQKSNGQDGQYLAI